ncbi:DUF3102 domain-containing protein [Streptococcus anginosus]|uniref:DUF3102 domain-containing protein n=1 Tax=Streptococcus anginosus TaxID=1328 RepID=A0ABT3EAE6_STRAP|nr:DUF3102 domain-containing protein [Streptococcus anginosus]MCW1028831.1 DUF3102 domain-containing protein [Streptococcus anginosus]MCW1042416.1 DUF3102 domain-containing protein [Streptococcus anginosus]MED5843928.1 DUF3102 domain-containing protein [Streptococcus anginosus]MED5970499.1 DUF3102 domain-containing protein [Streptococcus anginosus]MED5977983.1 DUF3102 domain-containing protein [Streptococcus anginosus]
MQEIALSNNLAQIELEINHHKQLAGQSIWEIGRRLNHVKENDLVHGQFMDWYKGLGIDKDFASKSMKIAKELPNFETLRNLGTTALHLIATLPDDQKQEQIERIEEGDSPTVRELQDLRRQLNLSKADNKILQEKNERLADQALKGLEKKTVTKEVVKEVVPDDYTATKQLNNTLLEKNKNLVDELDSVKRSLKLKEASYQLLEKETSEAIALKDSLEHLRADKQKLEASVANVFELSNLAAEFETFFDEKMAPLRFKALIQGAGKEIQIDKIRQLLTLTENWLSEMNKVVPEKGRAIVEGEIVNE